MILLSSLFLVSGILAENYESFEDIVDIPDDFLLDEDENDEILRKIEEKANAEDIRHENMHAQEVADRHQEIFSDDVPRFVVKSDPCSKVHCGAGRVCESKNGDAKCVCIQECPSEVDPRRKVCTNLNETWDSDCEVHRQRCLCQTNSHKCRVPDHHHIHIEYYGECREIPTCTEDEMLDFPRRMREWLFNVMNDLAGRQELSPYYIEMSHEAETNLTRRWVNAAIWKFCDLDKGHDRSVSRHELFPIRAPLLSLEHCISPFLEGCDSNNDHRITLLEWGKCLELDESELEERCEDINSTNDATGNEI
jgi:Fe2+ or Zn2+ uptake regulation protein